MVTANLRFDRFRIEWIPISELIVHPKTQRPFRPRWAQKLAAEFDPDMFQPLDVVRHGHKFAVFAGQHRLAAARLALGADQKLPCHIHPECPLDRQAAITLGVGNTLPWIQLDEWPMRVTAREEVPLKITAILDRHSLRVHRTRAQDVIQAVVALETVYRSYGGESTLDRVLSILISAYGDDKDRFDGLLIRGLGFLLTNAPDIYDSRLTDRLMKAHTPRRLLAVARDTANNSGIAAYRAMAEKILRIYNGGRGGDKHVRLK